MIKRLLVIALAAIMVLGLVACKNDEIKETEPPVMKDFEYTVLIKVMDSWKVEKEDGTRDYYLTLFASSENMYCEINNEDVRFYSDAGYKTLEETINGSEVSIVNLNEDTKKGVAACIMIKTTNMIDTKKINISLDGPSEYDAECLDKTSYEAKHGKGSWGSVMSKVSSQSYSSASITQVQSGVRYGMLCPVNQDGLSLALYFDQRGENKMPVADGSKYYVELDVVSFSNRDIASFKQYFEDLMYAKDKIDLYEGNVELDKNVTTYAEYIDGKMRLGYQTVDGSDIASYIESFPEWLAVVYSGGASYLKFK